MKTLLLILAATAAIERAPIVPREIAPIAYREPVRGAATAFAGDRFLAVWPHVKAGRANFVGSFYDASGNRISPAAVLIVEDSQIELTSYLRPPLELLTRENGYTLFWRDRMSVRHFVELDLDGNVLRRATVPFSGAGTEESYAWNGRHYFAAIKRAGDTDGFEFTREGTLVQRVSLERRITDAKVIPSNDGFLVFTASDVGGAAVQRVDPSGKSARVSFLSPFALSITATPTGDGGAMAVWVTRDQQLRAARVSATLDIGTVHELTFGRDLTALNVARSSNGFRAVLWAGADNGYLHVYELDEHGAKRSDHGTAHDEVTLPIAPEQTAANAQTTLVLTPLHAVSVRNGASQSGILPLAPIRQSDPSLVATGNGNTLATWFESSATTTTARAAVLDAVGRVTRTSIVATDVVAGAHDLAWNGSEVALLVMRRGTQLLGARIGSNARPLDAEPFVIGTTTIENPVDGQARASVTWTGDRWLVAWMTFSRGEIYTAEVEASGGAGPARLFRVPVRTPVRWLNFAYNVNIAASARDVLLMWDQYQAPECIGLCSLANQRRYAVRLDEDGQAREAPLDLGVAILQEPANHSLRSNGDDFLAVIHDTVTLLRTDGDVLYADGPRNLLHYPGWMSSSIDWDGEQFVVALRYGYFAHSHLALFRLDRDARPAAPPRYLPVRGLDSWPDRPSVAAERGFAASVAFTEDAGPADTGQVSVVRESDFGPLPAPPRAPVFYVERLPNGMARVSWAPQPDAEGIVVRSLFATPPQLRVVPADRSPVTVFASDRISVYAFNAGGISPLAEAPSPLPPKQRSAGQ